MPDSDESHIVSFASYPPPTDSIIFFSLSRDRTLRAWNYVTCVASYSIKSISKPLSSLSSHGEGPVDDSRGPLLGPEPQKLLLVLPASNGEQNVDDSLRVLVFIPSPASLESGGRFHLFRVSSTRAVNKEFTHIQSIACPPRTAGAELRDFMVYRSCLHVLWDQMGQPVVECTSFDPDVINDNEEQDVWYATTYPPETELTSDYLDELLLRSGGGSLVDAFMTAILRPGIFSYFTIETALQQYTDSLLSIPGAQSGPLLQSFLTLSEHIAAVVGCTVNVIVDPRTGIPQRANYWNALKRDWEGFVARCREIERSGRWPLSLGVTQSGAVLLLERERAGCVATSDEPLEVRAGLSDEDVVDVQPILHVGLAVRQNLSNAQIHARESQFEIMVSQERGYTYEETLAHCVSSLEDPRQDITNTVLQQLVDVSDLGVQFEQVLDVLTSIPSDIKVEETEDSSGPDISSGSSSLPVTRWSRGVAIAYVHASVEARYELCLTLVLLLFHIGDRRQELSPVLLARIFATFRNLTILRYLAWQPAGDPDGTQSASLMDPDIAVLRGLQNMAVSSRRPTSGVASRVFRPTYSLNYRLLEEGASETALLPQAALRYFSMVDLLSSQDAAEVTCQEVLLCMRLLDHEFRDAALEVISRLPRSPGITYVHGLLLVQIGRTEDGASLLGRVGASFGETAWLWDQQLLNVKQVLGHFSRMKTLERFFVYCLIIIWDLTLSIPTTNGSRRCLKELAVFQSQYNSINWQASLLVQMWIRAICGEKSSLVIQSWRSLRKHTWR